MSAISPARKAAFTILMSVERGHSHSDDLLRGKSVAALSDADRNLATALVLGTLRWQIRLDHQLQAFLKRPNAKLDAEVLIALRLGAFQLTHLDRIPASAAIDESVELAKQAGHRYASGMVNAVLRKLSLSSHSQDGLEQMKGTDGPPQMKGTGFSPYIAPSPSAGALHAAEELNSVKGTGFSPYISPAHSTWALAPEGSLSQEPALALALAQAHPAWLVERWTAVYGLEAARTICCHGQNQPTQTVRIDSPAVEAEFAEAGIRVVPGELLTKARSVVSGDVTATAAFREARVRMQDEGSQLVAEIAGHGNSILDCCAAPGGKTLILAERNPQAHIVACESSPQRLAQLRKRLEPLGDRMECRLVDATELADNSAYDVVLADVPCSGTGTLGRNPEIRHRLRPEDLPRQAKRQRAILRAALQAVRPGGRVVYSTCSLEPEENEQVVAAVLSENHSARQVPLTARIDELRADEILGASGAQRLHACITQDGSLRLLPGVFQTDGFFIALFERV